MIKFSIRNGILTEKINTKEKDIEKINTRKVKTEKNGFLLKELMLKRKEKLNSIIKVR